MFTMKHRYLEEADDGKGGSGGDDDDKGTSDSVSKEDFDKLQESVSGLAKSLEGIQVGFGQIKETLEKPKEPEQKLEEPKNLDIANLETMSRQDLAVNIIETVVDRVKRELIDPVSQKVGSVEEQASETTLKALVKEAETAHKDFWDWKPEVLSKLKASPGLTPSEAYTLCRASNPEKAKEMDKKYAEGDKDKNDEGDKGGKPPFGGMPPGGSKTTPSQNMSKKDAAEAAWEEVMQ